MLGFNRALLLVLRKAAAVREPAIASQCSSGGAALWHFSYRLAV